MIISSPKSNKNEKKKNKEEVNNLNFKRSEEISLIKINTDS